MNGSAVLRGLLMLVGLVAVGFAIKLGGLGEALDTAWMDTEIKGRGLSGMALFLAIGGLFTGIGLPRQIVSFLGGYAFGFVLGTALSLVATVIGLTVAFGYARMLGRKAVAGRGPERLRRLDAFLSRHTFQMALILRLLPVGSNVLANLAAGLSGVSFVAFTTGSAIGYIPQTAVFALVGSGINVEPTLRIVLSVVLFIASALLGVHVYRRHIKGRTDLPDPVADPGAEPEGERR